TALRQRASRQGLGDAVSFVGAQPQERLRDYYVAADATVLPSYYESFGMVALEAMACGSPVVASRVGGLTTTIQDGVTGRLVPEGDPAALAAAITSLIGTGEGRLLGQQATRWAAAGRAWRRRCAVSIPSSGLPPSGTSLTRGVAAEEGRASASGVAR
ncbi:MAG: glycosyltransferase, partial [Candidatus Rokuibacteriota bacterium]